MYTLVTFQESGRLFPSAISASSIEPCNKIVKIEDALKPPNQTHRQK